MGRADQVGDVFQGTWGKGEGLVFVDVECSCSYAAFFESLGKSILINEATTWRVDEEGPLSHLFDGELVDKVVVVFIQGAVQGHTVTLEQ